VSPEHWITLTLVAIAGVLAFISAWQQAGKADREELRREAARRLGVYAQLEEDRMREEHRRRMKASVAISAQDNATPTFRRLAALFDKARRPDNAA
jgi:hypothetical protein